MNPVEPTVKQATELDIDIIEAHLNSGYMNPCNPHWSSSCPINLNPVDFLVAEVDGKYAGFLQWNKGDRPAFDSDIQSYARIVEVRVKREFMNTLVYPYLMKEFFKITENEKVQAVYSDPPEGNRGLIELYEKMGFTKYTGTYHMRFLYPKKRETPNYTTDEATEIYVYLVEMHEQCRMAIIAYNEMEDLIDLIPNVKPEDKANLTARIWSRIQTIMSSSKIVTRIIWPTPPPKKGGYDKHEIWRAKQIRDFIKFKERSPLLSFRVRDAFEHVDDKLFKWLDEGGRESMWGWSLSPFLEGEEDEAVKKAFRYYNIFSHTLRVAGESCNLREIVEFIGSLESILPSGSGVNYENFDAFTKKGQNH